MSVMCILSMPKTNGVSGWGLEPVLPLLPLFASGCQQGNIEPRKVPTRGK